MWQKPIKKTIFLLNIGNFEPQITELTYPLIRYYARKIGADVHIITKRRYPEWPVVYEKLQIYDLAREMQNDWNMYIDSDALVHPETIDFTQYLPHDTVMHNGIDMAAVRWKYDRYFLRDGRNIGSCNWLTMASDWCVELWKPLEDLTFRQAVSHIFPTREEANTVITADHLIDDYTLSRNIAQYGLKLMTVPQVLEKIGMKDANFFWHLYTITGQEKVKQMKDVIEKWEIQKFIASL